MFCYKVKVSINENCEKYPKYEKELKRYIKSFKLTSLGNNEYGTDRWETGMAFISALSDLEWFVHNAKECIWYNGDECEQLGDYHKENALESMKRHKWNDR